MLYALVAVVVTNDSGEPDIWDHEVCAGYDTQRVKKRLESGARRAGFGDVKAAVSPLRTERSIQIGVYDATAAAEYEW